jgi:uncharacterized membrane protein YbhN (UPF0104 family)
MSAPNRTTTPPAQKDSRHPGWLPSLRQVVQGLIGLGVAAVLLVWGLPHFVGTTWHEVFDRLQRIGPGTALQLLALMLCGLWLYTFTLTGSLPGLSHGKALILNVCGSSVGNLLPGGGAAGLAATYGLCRSWGFSRRDISASVIASGVWNVLGRLALPIIGTGVLLTDATELPEPVVHGAAIGTVAGLALLALFIAVIVSERTATAIGHSLDRVLGRLWRRAQVGRDLSIEELVQDLRCRLSAVIRTGWASMTFGVVGFLGVYYVLFWFCLDALDVRVSFAHMFAAYAVGRLLSTVGVTPGGLGITETGTVAVLIGFGAHPAAAMAGVVLFSIYIHLLEIPLGAVGWVVWGVSRKKSPKPDSSLEATGDVPPVVASPTN